MSFLFFAPFVVVLEFLADFGSGFFWFCTKHVSILFSWVCCSFG